MGIALFYCDYRDQKSQTLVNILGSLLQQLLLMTPQIPNEVQKKLESIRTHRKKVEAEDISQMLEITFPEFHQVFICIDALDELEPRTRFSLLASLGREFANARIFLTGRPFVQQDIKSSFEPQNLLDSITITANSEDISLFLSNEIEVENRINPHAMNSKLKEEIMSRIISGSKGM